MQKFRIGFGYDVHQLTENRKLIIGGVDIPHHVGLLGHSDADVLIHAICDALLGAANLRDIGFHFPNNAQTYKDASSVTLLQEVVQLLAKHQYAIGNIDATLALEAPKINPYIPAMQQVLSQAMNIEADAVSIKATTNETMGYVGRHQGANAYAVALIYKLNQ
ncbi:MAG: 2-C-methyl-D-erythritol 2,4-cyclodiphosphate synthase [Bacteroidia bacterium]|nr:2-C-methyl-D-erythritol 2,4-cyclodiphosphate synthase [Bacteroidia bacterium]